MRRIIGTVAFSLCITLCRITAGTTWYVNASAPEAGDGHSPETAFQTIQVAIEAASNGDTVIVAWGTYRGNIHFSGKNITLTSTDPFDPAVVAQTIIAVKGGGPVVTFSGTEEETCVLSGFTIQGGNALYGGGICGGDSFDHTDATICNNLIIRNSAHLGGGIAFCDGLIAGNTISQNSTTGDTASGGGLLGCNGEIQNNIVSHNSGVWGGGLCECEGTIRDNIIKGNSGLYGGGLARCPGTIQNNTISENSASAGGGFYYCGATIQHNTIFENSSDVGGGLYGCHDIVQGNVISGNSALWAAGLALCDGVIQNNTIVGNSALWYGGGLGDCEGTVRNSIIWGNKPRDLSGQLYQSSIPTFSCIEHWNGGTATRNFANDPRFVDPDGRDNPQTFEDNDYRLPPDSPCIDAGNNDVANLPDTDILGNPRILYGGKAKTPTVDLGAYEYYINEIEVNGEGQIILTWSSRSATMYSVYCSSDMVTWELAAEFVPSKEDTVTKWVDLSAPLVSPAVRGRYYKVTVKPKN